MLFLQFSENHGTLVYDYTEYDEDIDLGNIK